MKDGLENHSKDHKFLLGQWLKTTLFHHEINQDFINLARKFVLPGIFLGYKLFEGGFWKGDILIVGLEDLENWTHQKFTIEEST